MHLAITAVLGGLVLNGALIATVYLLVKNENTNTINQSLVNWSK